jgi:hypothetical protein
MFQFLRGIVLIAAIMLSYRAAFAGDDTSVAVSAFASVPSVIQSHRYDKPTSSHLGSLYPTTPNVGSSEWKNELAENERQEQHLKQVIGGICHGC